MLIDSEVVARVQSEWVAESPLEETVNEEVTPGINPFIYMILGSGLGFYLLAVLMTGRLY